MKVTFKNKTWMLALISLSSCASWTPSQKRLATSFGAASVCATATHAMAQGQDDEDIDVQKSVLANAFVCGMGGHVAGEFIYRSSTSEEIERLRQENAEIKRAQGDGRLVDLDKDDVLRLSPPRQSQCNGEMRMVAICPNEDGEVGACQGKIGWQYINSSWAVKWVAYKSVEACFIPPFKAPVELERLIQKLDRNLN